MFQCWKLEPVNLNVCCGRELLLTEKASPRPFYGVWSVSTISWSNRNSAATCPSCILPAEKYLDQQSDAPLFKFQRKYQFSPGHWLWLLKWVKVGVGDNLCRVIACQWSSRTKTFGGISRASSAWSCCKADSLWLNLGFYVSVKQWFISSDDENDPAARAHESLTISMC